MTITTSSWQKYQVGSPIIFTMSLGAEGPRYYSIYDATVEYEMNVQMSQKAEADHKGGFYVYATPKEAVFAEIPKRERGGLFMAPRTVIR